MNEKIGFTKEVDFNQYQYNELNEMNFSENELENLDAELQLLSNAESIKTALQEASYTLNENENPIISTLKQLTNKLESYQSFYQQIAEIVARLRSSQIELQDIVHEIDGLSDKFIVDGARMQIVNDRMAAGYKLLKKHGVATTKELLDIRAELAKKIEAVLNIDEQIHSRQNETSTYERQSFELAGKLSSARRLQIDKLEKAVNEKLFRVGMPNAALRVQLEDEQQLNPYGINVIDFLFDANKSNRFEPLRKVASGGELSRLMLCIKSLVAESVALPTLIFDEIDSGISGEAAKQVGIIMKDLSKHLQVIAITHQPQIAARANTHFYVYKKEEDDGVKTKIKKKKKEDRIFTIAQMLGGEKPTAAALQSAKEMMEE
jgi:DNA repair protein RecN (Recombination protein N)